MYRLRLGTFDKTAADTLRDAEPNCVEAYVHVINGDDDNFLPGVFEEAIDFADHPCIQGLAEELPRLFTNPETAAEYEHYNARIVDKAALENIILRLKNSIVEYFKSLTAEPTADDPRSIEDKLRFHMQEKLAAWETPSWVGADTSPFLYAPFGMPGFSDKLVRSNLWEYQIFELVRFYRALDFDKKTVVLYGW